jgi:uncharacterized protein
VEDRLSHRVRAVVLSGGGAYADPWHPFAATSELLAEIVGEAADEVEIDEDIEARLKDLSAVDLLIVNAARGPVTPTHAEAQTGLEEFLNRGGGVIAVHVGVCALLNLAGWPEITGAAWVDGQSGHPPLGLAHIRTFPDRHPVVGPIEDFDLVDERYTNLGFGTTPPVPLAAHDLDGTLHPLVWVRSRGPARIVSDSLGHGTESYDSPAHVTLLQRAALWATHRLG